MSKNEKKVLFKSYMKTLDAICDKKDLIERLQRNQASEQELQTQHDGLEKIESYADGLYHAIAILNLDGEFYQMNW